MVAGRRPLHIGRIGTELPFAKPEPMENEMRNVLPIVAFAFAFALAAPALAEDLTRETMLGTTLQEVQSNLTAMGYEVRKAELEDGRIEVYVVKGNAMAEIYVDPATGRITRLDMD
jgi:hypothetical protein